MTLVEVLQLLSQHNIQISLENGQLKVSAAKGVLTNELKLLLRDHKEELLAWAQKTQQKQQQSKPISPRGRVERLPLSFAQQRLWFVEQLAPGSVTYNLPAAIILRGQLQINILQNVMNQLLARHEALRTCFVDVDGEAEQQVLGQVTMPLHAEAVPLSLDDKEELLVLAKTELLTPFDLGQAPLFRLRLLRLNNDINGEPVHLLLLNLHHIITDGWSNGILLQEIAHLYQAEAVGVAANLPELGVQYADYALWQQQMMPLEVLAEKTEYWRQQLADVPVLEMPTDKPRPAQKSGRGQTCYFSLGLEARQQLDQFARSQGCTSFVVLLAAYQLLLYRYTGQDDICVGSPIANRTRAEIQHCIGFFVNTLALRGDLSGNPTFAELVQRTHKVMLAANEHQDVPFESMVDALGVSREMSTTPIFQTAISYQQGQTQQLIELPNLNIEMLDFDSGTAKFDITLGITEHDHGLDCLLEFDTDIFTATTMQRLGEHFSTLLQKLLNQPQQQIDQVSFLSDEELSCFTERWHGTHRPFSKDVSLATLIEHWAETTPDKIAIDFPGQQLSYSEFNQQASQLAHYLKQQGFGRGDRLAVCIQRSPAMLVAVFAALKNGGCYIPVDPQYPDDRISYMLEDSSARFAITLDENVSRLQGLAGSTGVLGFESLQPQLAKLDGNWQTPAENNQGEDLAYIMYTSGSTGQPKGVMMPQRGVCRLALNTNFVEVASSDNVAHMCNIAFDATAFEIWTALLNGCTLVGIEQDVVLDPAAFADYIASKEIRIMVMTVALFNLYISHNADTFAGVNYLFVGGEALDPNKVRECLRGKKPAHLMNGYGPTENACFTVCYDIQQLDDSAFTVPLGFPVSNNACYILDKHQQLVPVGVAGELYASGDGIALGYLNKPEQTAAAFIPNRLPNRMGEVLYRTGDICRWTADGRIEMLGRVDDQVKLRGFRIELGEIHNQLGLLPEVADCAVLVNSNAQGNKYLAAFVVPREPVAAIADHAELIQRIKQQLSESLPHYMVPQAYGLLDELPMTANGKLDKRALPEPEFSLVADVAYIAPRNPWEVAIAEVWQEILGINDISVLENFFEAGGHSLLATRVIGQLRQKLQMEIALRELFDNPTIAELALRLQVLKGRKQQLPKLAAAERPEQIPLSYAQQRMWFIEQLQPGSPVYNMPFALRMRGELDVTALRTAMRQLVMRHETLRSRVVSSKGMAWQQVDVADDWQLPFYQVDLDEQELISRATEFVLAPFDLARGPLLRAELLQQQQTGDYILLLCQHHIISDGWSMDILLRDLLALYQANQLSVPPSLPQLPVQYVDYALWQRQWLNGDVLQQQIDYWAGNLAGLEPLALPTDFPRPPQLDASGHNFSFSLPVELSARVRTAAQEHGLTLYMFLLGAFQLLLGKYSRQQDVAVGTPVANRPVAELENLIGLFVNTLVVRSQFDGEQSVADFMQQLKQTTLAAYQHQDVPFELLVDELKVPRDLSQTPLFQVMFILQSSSQNQQWHKLAIDGLEIEALSPDEDQATAKFDMTLNILDTADKLRGVIEYRTSLYSAAFIERFSQHYLQLLDSLCSNAEQRIAELDFISPQEQSLQLEQWNATDNKIENASNLQALFEQQVAKTPEAIAVSSPSGKLSFRAFNQQVNQLAHYFVQELGLEPGQRIAICQQPDIPFLQAIMAAVKAGLCYVPMDVHWPDERIAHIIRDAEAKAVLTDATQHQRLAALGINSNNMAQLAETLAQLPVGNPPNRLHDDLPLYVIYTSGSTGLPKGVEVKHQGERNLIDWYIREFAFGPADSMLIFSGPGFDLTQKNFFAPLCSGGRVVLPVQEHYEPQQLARLIDAEQISCFNCAPSALYPVLEMANSKLASLRTIFLGGEPIQPQRVAPWLAANNWQCELVNMYGPTECTDIASIYRIRSEADLRQAVIPIGRPIQNTRLYVLDAHLQLLPVGCVGELYISGLGVSNGYLNNSELNAQSFVANPYALGERAAEHQLLYKTGDLVRYRPDGDIEYIGRTDFQVKIRGLRIELGEIESCLQAIAGIREALVLAEAQNAEQEKQLLAYYLADEAMDNEQLRQQLAQELPDYMLPAYFIHVRSWPLNANGKIDRKQLQQPDWQQRSREYVAPRNALETTLQKIWQQVLPVAQIGVEDNFFELGGHSLLATRVIAEIGSQLDIELPVRALFEAPTIAELAAYIENTDLHQQSLPAIQRIDRNQPLPLSFNQQRLWLVYKMAPEAASYNMPMALRLTGELNLEALAQAVNRLIERHESLRTHFHESEGDVWQQIDAPWQWQPIAEAVDADIKQQVAEEAARPFDLLTGPLLRLRLWQEAPQQYVFMVTLHHIIADAITLENLVQELVLLYQSALQGLPAILPPLAFDVADYAWWQQHVLRGEYLDKQLDYWQRKLHGAPALLKLPTDKPRPQQQSHNGQLFNAVLSSESVSRLRDFARSQGLTPFMVLLAVQQLLLGRYARQDDVCIGVPVAGRHQAGTERLVGFFINALVMRVELQDNTAVGDYFKRIKDEVLAAFAHQDAPVEQVIERLNLPRSSSYNPLVQVGFNYISQQADLNAIQSDTLKIEALTTEQVDAKYDMIWAFVDNAEGISATVEFNTDLYYPATIERMFSHFEQLLHTMLDNLDAPVKRLSLCDQTQLQQLLAAEEDGIEQILPLTPMQQDLYLDGVLHPDNRRNYLGWVQRADQLIDVAVFQQAMDIIVRHYAALRMRVVASPVSFTDMAYQLILTADNRQSRVTVQALDWADEALNEEAINARCDALTYAPYQLADEPLLRCYIIRTATDRSAILAAGQHICVDGIAMQMITEAYIKLYEGLLAGQSAEALAAELAEDKYTRYVTEQYALCDNAASLSYWREQAQGVEPLKASQSRNSREQGQFISYSLRDNPEHYTAIQAYCKQHRTSPITYLKALYSLALQSFCYADRDFYFSEIIGARPMGHLREVGCYFEQRPVVLRQQALAAGEQFSDLLRYFDGQRKTLRSGKNISNNQQLQLFEQGPMQCLFNFYTLSRSLPFNGGELNMHFFVPEMPNALTLTAIVDDDALLFNFSYTDNIFTDNRFVERLLHLSQQVLAGVDELAALSLQLPEELEAQNADAIAYDTETVIELIQRQVSSTPDAEAVRDSKGSLSYSELNQAANRLAHYLHREGIKAGDKLALCHSGNCDFMVALLAALKVGACYIPADPNYPAGRIRYILEDSAASCIISESCQQQKLHDIDCRKIYLDTLAPQLAAESTANLPVNIAIDDPLYMIYTSGSTGQPKGAVVKQRGEINLLQWYQQEFAFGKQDNFLIISAIGFDLTQKNLLGPLVAGSTVVFPSQSEYDPDRILADIAKHKVSVINCAPSAFYPLAEAAEDYPQLSSLRLVLFGGEPIRISSLLGWLQSANCQAELVNMYGPTECTDIASFYRVREPQRFLQQPIPIGIANDHVQLTVVDSSLRPLPKGLVGELVIGGEGLGLGYLGREELTAEKFIQHPSLGAVYRTGDLVLQLAEGPDAGHYVFVNRIDHQVKVRGLRIELGEIEFALRQLPGVEDSLVTVANDSLLAYVVTEDGSVPADWRTSLSEELPLYMVPQQLLALSAWPLTANGKIDRKALPQADDAVREIIAPRTATEKQLLAIWQETLGLEQISIDDNFFELGGHSLLAARTVTRIRDVFGKELPLREVFMAPDIRSIASLLEQSREQQLPAITAYDRSTNLFPLSFAQQRLWLVEQIQLPSAMYNIPLALKLSGSINASALEQALQRLLQRHEALRTRITDVDGTAWQYLAAQESFTLAQQQVADETLTASVQAFLQQPFILLDSPLFSSLLLQTPSHSLLLLNMHHIIADGLSMQILLQELAHLYQAISFEQSAQLPELPVQYIDYSLWQQQCFDENILAGQVSYWQQQLAELPTLQLPLDKPRSKNTPAFGRLVEFELSRDTSTKLQQLAQREQTSLFNLMLASFALLLYRYSGRQDVAIGTPTANRPQAALERVVGFFVNTLVLRNRFNVSEDFSALLANTRNMVTEALANQDLPFERLLDELDIERDLSLSPLFQVFFTLQQAGEQPDTLEIGDTRIEAWQPAQAENIITQAKFDLSLNLLQKIDSISGNFEYRTALFDAETIKLMAEHFIALLDEIAGFSTASHQPPLQQMQFFELASVTSLPWPKVTEVENRGKTVAAVKQQARNTVEERISRIWCEVLQLKAVDIHANFFALGGHSLKAAQVVSRLRKTFQIDMLLRDLFDRPTIAELALLVEQRQLTQMAVPEITAISRSENLQLSYAQQRLWFLAQMDATSPAYNMPAAFRLRGKLNKPALQQALDNLLERHEVLRSAFINQEGEPQLLIQAAGAFPLAEAKARDEAGLKQLAQQDVTQPFDLTSGLLLRATLVELNPEHHALLLNMHHIISDGWSVQVLIRELASLYLSYSQQLPDPLPVQNLQYVDYSAWQRSWLQGDVLDQQISYWKQELANAPALLQLPLDHPRPQVQSFRGALLQQELPTELAEQLRELSRNQGCTLFMTCLAAYQLLLSKYSQQQDICVGIPLAGRSVPGVEDMVGFFINALIIRTDFSANLSVAELLQQVKRTSLAAFAHEHVPIEMVLNELGIERNLAYTPIAQCAFNMLSAGSDGLPQGINDLLDDIAIELIATENVVAKFDIQFSLLDSEGPLALSVEYNTDIFEASTIAQLVDDYQRLLQWFVADSGQTLAAMQLSELDSRAHSLGYQKLLPLTPMQRDIYLSAQANPQTRENSLGYALKIPQPLNTALWREALELVANRYQVLRADLVAGSKAWDDMAYLGIRSAAELDYTLLDWSRDDLSDEAVQSRLDQLVSRPYQLQQESGISYRLIRRSANEYWAVLAAHHLLLDGFAASLHLEYVSSEYNRLQNGEGNKPLTEDHFAAFATGSRQQFDRVDTLNYWQQQLADVEGLQAAHAEVESRARLISLPVPEAQAKAIRAQCRQYRITPALYFKALYGLLISHYCRAEANFVITEFSPGRDKDNRDNLGCFYHSYPTLVSLASLQHGVEDLFNAAIKQQKEARPHQQISALKLQRLLPPSALHFSFNYLTMTHSFTIDGVECHAVRYTPNAEGSVDLRVQADSQTMNLSLAYNPAIFSENRFLERLLSLSEQILSGEIQHCNQLRFTLADETGLNFTPAPATTRLVHEVIRAQALATPSATAVVCGSESLSYIELETWSNALAYELIQLGVVPGSRVGICLGRRVELLVAIIATIKAGGCYIPMDPSYPQDRLSYMLADSAATLLISESCVLEKLQGIDAASFNMDSFDPNHMTSSAPLVPVSGDDLLYMIYTSGSTGQPKGASVYHRSEANLLNWYCSEYGFTSKDKALVLSATGFDLTQKNFFALLCVGGTVVLPDSDFFDVQQTLDTIREQQITLINCAPSVFYPLVELAGDKLQNLLGLKALFFGGEPIHLQRMAKWIELRGFNTAIINMYGPTECTDISTSHRLPAAEVKALLKRSDSEDIEVALGQAIPGVKLYLLNEQGQQVAPGLVGELCVSGISVGAGYWQKPELTAAAFMTNPYSENAYDHTLYRTGDLVQLRKNAAGESLLYYIGRKDFQVKLRGLRIELGEIEQALRSLPAVQDCLVLVDENQLLAFVQGKAEELESWRQSLALQLPEYMIPHQLMTLESWPLTPNGKVDRNALLALERDSQLLQYVAPRNALESELANLWQEVLGVGEVGVFDNFFEAGGDSLSAVRLMARIELRFEIKLPVASLFGAQTIAQLAHVIHNQTSDWSPLVPIQPQGSKTPIFAIHALGGMVISYEPLARALGKEQPFYGLQAYGFEDEQTPFTDLNELVEYYLLAIKQQQANGPYQLLGHSIGGLIAVELARKLQQMGDEVSYLGLLDTHMPANYVNMPLTDAYILKTFAEHNFGVVDIPLKQLQVLTPDVMIKKVAEQFHGAVSEDFIRRAIAIIRGFHRMLMNYKPKPLPQAIYLYTPETALQGVGGRLKKWLLRDKAKNLGWHKISPALTQLDVDGDHFSMLKAEHAEQLAQLIKQQLSRE